MKTYQYDTVGDIYNRLFEIERLLEVIAGIESKEDYLKDKRARRIMEERMREQEEEE